MACALVHNPMQRQLITLWLLSVRLASTIELPKSTTPGAAAAARLLAKQSSSTNPETSDSTAAPPVSPPAIAHAGSAGYVPSKEEEEGGGSGGDADEGNPEEVSISWAITSNGKRNLPRTAANQLVDGHVRGLNDQF